MVPPAWAQAEAEVKPESELEKERPPVGSQAAPEFEACRRWHSGKEPERKNQVGERPDEPAD